MRSRYAPLVLAVIIGIVVAVGIAALLVTIVARRQEARLTYFKVVEIPDDEPDPAVWGRNFPNQYEAYLKTMRTSELIKYSDFGRYGGSEAFDKLQQAPDLRTIFAGNSFSV